MYKFFLVIYLKLVYIFSNLRSSFGDNVTSGLVAYWNFDNDNNWTNPSYGGEPTLQGGAPFKSTTVKMFGTGGSLYLDGNSYLSIPATPDRGYLREIHHTVFHCGFLGQLHLHR
jgi:hypothetical protein